MRYHKTNYPAQEKAVKSLLVAAVIILIALGLGSCYSADKARKQADHIANAHPEVLAAKCLAKFPPSVSGRDTLTKTDSIPFFVECPDNEGYMPDISTAEDYAGKQTQNANLSSVNRQTSSVNNLQIKKGVWIHVPVYTHTVTIKEEDPRKILILQAEATKLTKKYRTLQILSAIGFSLAGAFLLLILYFLFLLFKLKK